MLALNKYNGNLNKQLQFSAGWNRKISSEITHCSIDTISQNLAKKGIKTDFKGNKVLAWCCEQTANIYNELNKKFGLNLKLPKEICVEDFSKLNIDDKRLTAFCNWLPAHVVKDSKIVYPERTLFFNKSSDWKNIDPIAEKLHKSGFYSHNHFLTLFFHEFGHSAHNGHLLTRYSPQELLKRLEKYCSSEFRSEYQKKYGNILSQISLRATHNPFESIADDMAKQIADSLEKNSLSLSKNPFKSTPYPNSQHFGNIKSLFNPELRKNSTKRKILTKAWNGNNIL